MQALARLCVRRPVFASVLIIALVVVGGVGYTRLGVDRYPRVDFPTVAVITRLPGAAPEEVETEVTDKIEESINTIAGIDDLQSVSAEGISQVFVTFILEKNVDVAAQEVRDKVNRVLADLPRDIDQPIVEKLDPDATPILSVALSGSRTLRETTEFADKVFRRQIESVNGVGQVTILGGRSRRINVRLDTERLKAYGLSAVDVRRALQTQNVKIPGGTLEEPARTRRPSASTGASRTRRSSSRSSSRSANGLPVRVGDVAKVEDSEEDAERAASKDGVPTVVLSVRKQSGTNTVAVVDALKERLAEIAPQLPAGYSTEIVRDQSQFIKAAVDAVQEHLVVGGFLAALVVLLFLGNLALDAHRRDRDPDVHHLDVRPHVRDGLHAERPDAARADARGRHRHRRRDRRPREHLPVHRGEEGHAVPGRDRRDEGDRPRGPRDDALARRGLPARRVHGRHRRPVHELLRPHDGVRDHGLAARLLLADADAVGAVAARGKKKTKERPGRARSTEHSARGAHVEPRVLRAHRPGVHGDARWSMAHRWAVVLACVLALFTVPSSSRSSRRTSSPTTTSRSSR